MIFLRVFLPRRTPIFLSHIIHDWSEDQCLTILGHVRKSMHPAARLLLVEMVLPWLRLRLLTHNGHAATVALCHSRGPSGLCPLTFAAEVDHLQGRGTFVGPCHTPFMVMLP